MPRTLWIDTTTGFSADRFVAALIGLGVPEQKLISIPAFFAANPIACRVTQRLSLNYYFTTITDKYY